VPAGDGFCVHFAGSLNRDRPSEYSSVDGHALAGGLLAALPGEAEDGQNF